MPTLENVARNMLAAHQATKRRACREARGPADLGCLIDVRLVGGAWAIATVPDRDFIGRAVDDLTHGRTEPLQFVGFLGDVYAKQFVLSEGEPQRVDAARAFASGDASVEECLVATVVDVASGEVVALRERYTYDDDGQPRFEQVTVEHNQQGQVVDNLRTVAARYRQ